MALETPSRPPPPFMANAILNFHFDFLKPSLKSFDLELVVKYASESIYIYTQNIGKSGYELIQKEFWLFLLYPLMHSMIRMLNVLQD